jgi:DNA modification methylase
MHHLLPSGNPPNGTIHYAYDRDAVLEENDRNRRSVWNVNTQPFPGAHFATFPLKLIEPCILCSTRPGDYVLDPFFGAGTAGLVAQQTGSARDHESGRRFHQSGHL